MIISSLELEGRHDANFGIMLIFEFQCYVP